MAWSLALLAPCRAAGESTGKPAGHLTLPYPIFMSYGAPSIRELDGYTASGLNALAVAVPSDATDDDRSRLFDLLGACEKRDLPVIVEIGDVALTESMRASAYDGGYVSAVREWVARVVGDLRSRRAICAWTTPALLCSRYEPNDEDFRAFLQGSYPSIDHLRRAWGIQVPGWSHLSLRRATEADPGRPGGFGPAALDYAAYRADAYRGLASLWLSAIAEADRGRPVFLGREVSRAAFACAPEPCVGVVADAGPPEMISRWQDVLPALSAARRGGSRETILAIAPAAETLRNAHVTILSALVCGARGVAFGDWQMVARNALLKRAMASATESSRVLGDAPFRPLPSVAILHEPFADGVQMPDGSGLYGFLAGISPGEPSRLASTYAIGHRYGLVDWIGADSIARGELSRYSVLLAPLCFDMPREAVTALLGWVHEGGVAVFDIGAGMRQSGSLFLLPPGLDMVTGAARLGRVPPVSATFAFVDAPPPLTHLCVGEQAVGDGGGPVFSGMVGGALVGLTAQLIADAGSWRGQDHRLYQSGIIMNRFGEGFCLLATGPLFANWGPDDPTYGALFDDLFAIGARIECEPAQGARPLAGDLVASAGDASLVVANLRDTQREPRVLVHAPTGQVLIGAWRRCQGDPSATPRSMELYLDLPPLGLARAAFLPVTIEGETWATVLRCDPDRLEMEVHPASADLVRANGKLAVRQANGLADRPRGQAPLLVRLRATDGLYRIAPNSLHRLTCCDSDGQTRFSAEVRADRSGVLVADLSLDADRLTLTPADGG